MTNKINDFFVIVPPRGQALPSPAERKEKGLCTECASPAAPQRKMCRPHLDAASKRTAARNKRLRSTDLNFKLTQQLRARLGNVLRGRSKGGSFVRDLGCTILELKKYLESKFQPGMTWENWGKYGWHIDHIVPLASFDLTKPEEFLKAAHYSNLQPLWATENLKKGCFEPQTTRQKQKTEGSA